MLRALAPFVHYLSCRKRALATVFALGLAGAGVSLATPLVGMAFVDAVATRHDFAAIPGIAAWLMALAVVDLVLGAITGRAHAKLSADLLTDLRGALFARCVDVPLDRVESLRHGDLMTRFGTDVARIETLLVDGALGVVSNALFLAVAAAIAFALSPPLALWSFAGVGVALAAATLFRAPIERRSRRVRDAMTDVSHFLSERLSALRAIRLHRTQAEEKALLAVRSERLAREVVGFHVQEAVASGVPGVALTLSLAWIYIAGGGLLESGAITLGTFVAFVLYQARLFGPANGLVALVRNVQEARVSVERVAELLDGPAIASQAPGSVRDPWPPIPFRQTPDSVRGPGQRMPYCEESRSRNDDVALALENVTFAYPGKPPVFRNVDLRIAQGERVALLGASGAGKSTLVQLLFGLRTPGAGRVVANAAELGYAGAEPFLLHASIDENIRYGRACATDAAVERAARLAEAHAFIEALPAGYATIVGGRGLALSDGQRQRLGLARLFLRDAETVVLDEAFSALDVETEMRIRESLLRTFAGRTMLVVTHRPLGLADFHRVLGLRDGRFVELSPADATARPLAA